MGKMVRSMALAMTQETDRAAGRTSVRLSAGVLALCLAQAAPGQQTAHESMARDILAELIAANTAPSGGNDMRDAVSGLVTRLKNAGFSDQDIRIVAKTPELQNLVVRYRSKSPTARPILMMAHLDVVEALPEDWTVDPFFLSEKDGYFYGRGTTDNKAGAAIMVANFIRMKREAYEPARDLIMMLTADEETSGDGARLLVTEHRVLIDAEFALNTDGGMIILEDDRPRAFIMQTSEKVYVSFTLEATDPGGHSSVPRADNPISRLSRTLVALQEFRFPIDLNETSRAFFRLWAPMAPAEARPVLESLLDNPDDPQLSAKLVEHPYFNALARTTCVATRLEAGHADNALPQTAKATVNCRVLPQSSAGETQNVLTAMAAKNGVSVTQIAPAKASPPSPLEPGIVDPVTEVANEMWPEITVIPEMSTGATDGLFVRNAGIPTYGVSAIAEDPDDFRAHGQDERIRAESYYEALEYWYRLVKVLSRP
jgi:acetylornithine deacetylase/succinyl-diaminopimelate desuccinylase-like protein